ncbi:MULTISPECIES: hypothetical protein [unclassified Janthinobacterium]|uniref:hypothetical protein n=1 Tax=unclassified Janthinobacterium TaxID=2610881 RepID=UPI000886890E|nr:MULTISPECIES: hypothetical protein [unclassified Janthinobacterium]SDA56736.1 hypothetical protein SAMN03159349_02025 [Janthinobacterium sp. 551a]SFB26691.1 hypothetical protein SAMN03159300_10330 [Janthinobacterium sp. 344]
MAAHAAQPSLAARPLALLAGAACVLALRHYPLGHGWPGLLFAALLPAYFLLLCWRPACWLFCLPALLPVLDLAPWTGWFFLEEIDLLLLLTLACGYWRLGGPVQPAQARLSPAARLCLLLCSLAWLVALLRGVLPLAPVDANAWDNYLSPYNSLRLGKAWAWSMLLLPLLLRDAGADNLRRYALPGLLAGLAMVSLFALWERAVFPGLLNMSSDYRITAPFSAMHTGGAALDGYLALSLPFAALWLARAHRRWHAALALALLGLALHAAFTTFSRGLYAAMLAAMLLFFWQVLAPGRRPVRHGQRPVLGLLLAGLGAGALLYMFSQAGYRGLLAAVVLLGASFVLAARPLPWRLAPASVLCALCLQAVLASWWPDPAAHQAAGWLKGPYCLFLLAALLLAGALWPSAGARHGPARLGVAMLAWTLLACNLGWIGWHWAGSKALPPAGLVVLLAMLMLCNGRLHPPLWRLDRASLGVAGAAGMLWLLAIPVSASYYATERFATTAFDLHGRLRHWQQVLAMQPPTWDSRLFGMGLGSFPATYYWHNPQRDVPASIRYADEGENRYVRLASPGYSAGYGELLRLLQRLPVQPATRYTLALDARRNGAMPVLLVRLCQRQLLYPQNCIAAPLRLRPPPAGSPPWAWQHYEVPLDSGPLGTGGWLLRAPVQLELAASGTATSSVVDIDKLSLRAPGGEELIANGQFSQANNYWFFSSDHHHLPWHVKNLALYLLVEAGWSGALAMLGLLCLAGLRLRRQCTRSAQGSLGRHGALACGAALAGFLVVGLFDSLLDVPRIALLCYLMLLCALLQPALSPPSHPAESTPP